MKIITSQLIALTFDNVNSIVFAEFPDVIKIDLAAAKEIVARRLSLTGDEKHYLVAEVSKIREVTPEAKEYFQKADGGLKNILAAAIIASNPVSALIANIFIKAPKEFQAKFFSSKADAMSWISEQEKKSGGIRNIR
jgi:hypothetical protein